MDKDLGGGRRIIRTNNEYKIQSKGHYSNSPEWSTIISLDDSEMEKIEEFKKEVELEERDKEVRLHCSRCGEFNDPDAEECKSCEEEELNEVRLIR